MNKVEIEALVAKFRGHMMSNREDAAQSLSVTTCAYYQGMADAFELTAEVLKGKSKEAKDETRD